MQVTIIKTDNEAALVEWKDGERTRRAIIPASVVQSGEVMQADLDAGMAVGEWEKLIVLPSKANVAERLRANGIWTLDDLRGKSQTARRAIFSAYAGLLSELTRRAESAEEV